jgi:Zn-dependent peptidase ImmA (M78 family)/DNA-binding XRE family transcriptional regulator
VTGDDARGVAAIFDPRRLKLARESRGLRKNELAVRVGVTPAAISQFELGAAKPSPATLGKLGLALQFPTGYFAQGRPVGGIHANGAHFRSLRSTSQLERNRASALCEFAWELTESLARRVRLPAFRLPTYPMGHNASAREIERIALDVRADLGIAPGPVGHVVRLLESRGVVVTRLLAGVTEVDAFSQSFPERPVVCLYADKHDGARSRHDGAHELGHLVMHSDAEPGNRVIERQAHAFAAAFLTPAEMIGPSLPSRIRWDHLLQLKACWGVSIKALVFRSRSLGIISESAYRRAMAGMSNRWGVDEPGEIPAEYPSLLARATRLLDAPGRPYGATQLAADARLPIDLTTALANLEDERPRVVVGDGAVEDPWPAGEANEAEA